jgi:Flp pilus assembly protein TadG
MIYIERVWRAPIASSRTKLTKGPTTQARAEHRSPVLPSRLVKRGQSLIEAALILPVFLLILGGLVDFGHAIQSYIAITNAANEGARFASREPTNLQGIQQHVENELVGTGITVTSVSVSCLNGPACTRGGPVRVQVNSSVPTIFGGIIGWQAIPITKSLLMVIL